MTEHLTLPNDVAIVTVSFNSSKQLVNFLSSATKSIPDPRNILIVDNHSSDIQETKNIASDSDVFLIELDENKGYGGAVNEACNFLNSEIKYIVVANPDCEFEAETISYLRTKLENDKYIGLVGPKILNIDGSIYPSGRKFPSIISGTGHALLSKVWPGNPWTKKYHSNAYLQNNSVSVGWVSGSFLMVPRDLFIKIGGFDETYFMYMEDVDLAYRISKLGFNIIYSPEVAVMHLGGESTKNLRKEMLIIHHQSVMIFLKKKYPGLLWGPIRFLVKIGLIVKGWSQEIARSIE